MVISAAQGTVVDSVTNIDNVCWDEGGYGNFARVTVPGSSQIIYAHMERDSVIGLGSVYQGDAIGRQGFSGHTEPCPPGGEHLHFEWVGGRPAEVNGETTVPLEGPNSTNSVIGGFSTAGLALRQKFVAHFGWEGVGWTSGVGPSLDMHRSTSPTSGTAWEQVFDHHAEQICGQSAGISGLYVFDYPPAQDEAFWVDRCYWYPWQVINTYPRSPYLGLGATGAPRSDRSPNKCEGLPTSCVDGQDFWFGYMWRDASGVLRLVPCFDPTGDGQNRYLTEVIPLARREAGLEPYSEDWDFDSVRPIDFLRDVVPEARQALVASPETCWQSLGP